jgi:hypothetical protein
MNIEEEMIEKAGQAMAREIDREVLWGMLEGIGWHRVMLSRNINEVDIKQWIALNCSKGVEHHGTDFIFEDMKDANWFKLRWLS